MAVAALLLFAIGFDAAAAGKKAALDPQDFSAVTAAARGQTVYFHAWGGSPSINDYIAWAARELKAQNEISLVHVKLADTADAVARIVAEKSAGRDKDGAIDLI